MNHEEYKEHLFTQIISMADVRSQKARKMPGDPRHQRAENALNALAKNLERVPSSDPFFARANNLRFGGEQMQEMTKEEVALMDSTELELISNYGYGFKGNGNPEQFLRNLVDKLTRSAVMRR